MSVRFVGHSEDNQTRIQYANGNSISSKNYIRKDLLDDSGLIFITRRDPISRLVVSITKQEFSCIGFYYVSRISRSMTVNVILVSPLEPTTTSTIDDLLADPLVTSIAIKKLRPIVGGNGKLDLTKTKQLHDDFRLAIANLISNNDHPSLKDRIFQLFGYPNAKNIVGVDIINSVIRKIGRWSEVPKQKHSSQESWSVQDIRGSTLADRAEFIGCLGSSLNQQHTGQGQIHSYITSNSLFEDLCYVRLNQHQQKTIDAAMDKIVKVQEPYLGAIFTEFIHLVFSDEKFFASILQGFKEGRSKDQELQQTLIQALQCSSESRIGDLSWISRNLVRGELPLQDLQSLLRDANEDHQALVDWFTSLHLEQRQPLQTPIPKFDTDNKVWIRTGKASIQDDQLSANIHQLHQLVSKVVNSANEDSQAYLDLNTLIECTNSLILASNQPIQPIAKIPDESSYSIVGIGGAESAKTNGDVVVRLDRGDEVYIPLYGANLAIFERNELLEILETLDSDIEMSINTQSYDNLRARITQELALR